jgi:putative hemolysin
MESVALEIIILIVLVVVNGLLAMAEMATVSARPERLRRLAKGPSRAAAQALELSQNPERLLATVQVGITLVGVLSGAYAGVTVAEQLESRFAQVPWLSDHAELASVVIVVSAITLLSLVFGELVPKRIALSAPERWATRLAPAMLVVAWLTAPLVWALNAFSSLALRALRVPEIPEGVLDDDEVDIIMEEGTRQGVFTSQERELVSRALDLDDLPVRAAMTPRQLTVALRDDMPPTEVLELAAATPYSRLPLLANDGEQVRGVVDVQRLLARAASGAETDPLADLQAPIFVPETGSLLSLMAAFRENSTHMAFVVDEYGSYVGVVTLHDTLRGLLGDVPDGASAGLTLEIRRRDDGTYLVDGLLPLVELREALGLAPDPEVERHCTTVSGLVMSLLQRMPQVGDRCEWQHARLEVVDMDRLRVDKVLLQLAPRP